MAGEAIFIGYRRDDTADVAGRIYDALSGRFGKNRVFKDVDNIGPGVDFGDYIKSVLPRCRVALILMGPYWVESKDERGRRRLDDPHDWVRTEIETALATPGVLTVPVLVNGARMPDGDELPASLHPLLRRNAAVIRRDPDFHDDVERLSTALRASVSTGLLDLSKLGGRTTPAPATETKRRNGSSLAWAVGGALALAVMGFGAWRFLPNLVGGQAAPTTTQVATTATTTANSTAAAPTDSAATTAAATTAASTGPVYQNTLTLRGHTDRLFSARFSRDGSRIVTAGFDGVVKVWNAQNGGLITTFRGHTDRVMTAAFSPDGSRVVSASADNTVKLWSANDGGLISSVTLNGPTDAEFSPDGSRIVVTTWERTQPNRTAKIFDATLSSVLLALDQPFPISYQPYTARFTRDGRRIATAHVAGRVNVWDASDGRLLTTIEDSGNTTHATFSPDGSRIVTADDSNIVTVWSASDGHRLFVLGRGMQYTEQAVFSPDGAYILTAQWYAGAKIWSVADRRVVASFKNCELQDADYSPDGSRIVLACTDGSARVWQRAP